ncbi:hypothetical protein NUH30_07580 [Leptospira sp. 85282-16]|uniref:Lipoprotein n=1 Tax=Leptospira montravelensis TaxID=2484961 RepID=A0ABY2LPU2_9LEPT|nr:MULTISPECIES: hypothetical protein [Leptospira]MCT8333530.1 hypothetical protein [Leptospira sp. 85282-16]TGK79961.1 hypothetical protein EHQ19_09600 [Leptospira montravelensis]TGL00128.1 hypothetical protein EHQ31_15020 [Leptospira montravelensis]
MNKIIVLLLSVAIFLVNCKTGSSAIHSSRVAHLPLAEAAYDIGQETSAKACNYELGFLRLNYEGTEREGVTLNPIEWYLSGITLGIYYYAKTSPDYSVTGAAIYRALKKTDGDILLDVKTTTQVDGFFFPDVCVTVSGKAASLTGPSGHTGRLKK